MGRNRLYDLKESFESDPDSLDPYTPGAAAELTAMVYIGEFCKALNLRQQDPSHLIQRVWDQLKGGNQEKRGMDLHQVKRLLGRIQVSVHPEHSPKRCLTVPRTLAQTP